MVNNLLAVQAKRLYNIGAPQLAVFTAKSSVPTARSRARVWSHKALPEIRPVDNVEDYAQS